MFLIAETDEARSADVSKMSTFADTASHSCPVCLIPKWKLVTEIFGCSIVSISGKYTVRISYYHIWKLWVQVDVRICNLFWYEGNCNCRDVFNIVSGTVVSGWRKRIQKDPRVVSSKKLNSIPSTTQFRVEGLYLCPLLVCSSIISGKLVVTFQFASIGKRGNEALPTSRPAQSCQLYNLFQSIFHLTQSEFCACCAHELCRHWTEHVKTQTGPQQIRAEAIPSICSTRKCRQEWQLTLFLVWLFLNIFMYNDIRNRVISLLFQNLPLYSTYSKYSLGFRGTRRVFILVGRAMHVVGKHRRSEGDGFEYDGSNLGSFAPRWR